LGRERLLTECLRSLMNADPQPAELLVIDQSAPTARPSASRAFTVAAEDNDFRYRWLTSGRKVRYEPEMVVWHSDWRTPEELRA
jgi:GT2 family glycosyltransferase